MDIRLEVTQVTQVTDYSRSDGHPGRAAASLGPAPVPADAAVARGPADGDEVGTPVAVQVRRRQVLDGHTAGLAHFAAVVGRPADADRAGPGWRPCWTAAGR